MMTTLNITAANTEADMEACLLIRRKVFCLEQNVSAKLEFDGLDDQCRHYLAQRNGNALGTARARTITDEVVKFERVAVLKENRRLYIGQALMKFAMGDAARDGAELGTLHAQTYAAPFYHKLGFVVEGEEFEEAEIPHVKMVCVLSGTTQIYR